MGRNANQIAYVNWDFTEPASINTITAASLTLILKRLDAIQAAIMSLGNDGLHMLIREQLREIRAARRARLDRERARRAKRKKVMLKFPKIG